MPIRRGITNIIRALCAYELELIAEDLKKKYGNNIKIKKYKIGNRFWIEYTIQ